MLGPKRCLVPDEYICLVPRSHNIKIIITIVTDTADVEQVVLGPQGVLHGARAGSVLIDMSTISPKVTRHIAQKCAEKGIDMLDAPVSGGDTGAAAGTLAIMVGGKPAVYQRCLPVFQAMGKTITHVGDHGMGQTVKLCNQILVAVTNMAVCEAILLAKKSGVDPEIMINATKNGAAGSWQLANLGPKMVARDFAPGFMVDLQQKDLRLAIEAAREQTLPAPALNLVHQLFVSCQAADEGRQPDRTDPVVGPETRAPPHKCRHKYHAELVSQLQQHVPSVKQHAQHDDEADGVRPPSGCPHA